MLPASVTQGSAPAWCLTSKPKHNGKTKDISLVYSIFRAELELILQYDGPDPKLLLPVVTWGIKLPGTMVVTGWQLTLHDYELLRWFYILMDLQNLWSWGCLSPLSLCILLRATCAQVFSLVTFRHLSNSKTQVDALDWWTRCLYKSRLHEISKSRQWSVLWIRCIIWWLLSNSRTEGTRSANDIRSGRALLPSTSLKILVHSRSSISVYPAQSINCGFE
jgi:hypothetical protein